jgi:hypothetical protein
VGKQLSRKKSLHISVENVGSIAVGVRKV